MLNRFSDIKIEIIFCQYTHILRKANESSPDKGNIPDYTRQNEYHERYMSRQKK